MGDQTNLETNHSIPFQMAACQTAGCPSRTLGGPVPGSETPAPVPQRLHVVFYVHALTLGIINQSQLNLKTTLLKKDSKQKQSVQRESHRSCFRVEAGVSSQEGGVLKENTHVSAVIHAVTLVERLSRCLATGGWWG